MSDTPTNQPQYAYNTGALIARLIVKSVEETDSKWKVNVIEWWSDTPGRTVQGGEAEDEYDLWATVSDWDGEVDDEVWGILMGDTNVFEVLTGQPGGGKLKLVKLHADCDADSTVSTDVYTGTPGAETDSGDDLDIFNKGPSIYFSGQFCIAGLASGNWYLVKPDGTFHYGVADAAIAKGSSGTVSILDVGGTDTGFNVTAFSPLGAIDSGDHVTVHHDGKNWIVTARECITS